MRSVRIAIVSVYPAYLCTYSASPYPALKHGELTTVVGGHAQMCSAYCSHRAIRNRTAEHDQTNARQNFSRVSSERKVKAPIPAKFVYRLSYAVA